jgi:hypothetical protein
MEMAEREIRRIERHRNESQLPPPALNPALRSPEELSLLGAYGK